MAETIDPRDVMDTRVGTPLRDAAVDPRDTDFLPPTNAGKPGQTGNPHGASVVSPGLHGDESIKILAAGEVNPDAKAQATAEKEALVLRIPGAAVVG